MKAIFSKAHKSTSTLRKHKIELWGMAFQQAIAWTFKEYMLLPDWISKITTVYYNIWLFFQFSCIEISSITLFLTEENH